MLVKKIKWKTYLFLTLALIVLITNITNVAYIKLK